jgi:hypothetical protein
VRGDVSPKAVVFADEQYVFVAETNNDGTVSSTRVLRAADGVRVKEAPGFAAVFNKRLRLLGRNILASENDATGALTLRLYDPLTGKDLWRQTFPARAQVLHSEEPTLTGAVEADGKVHVLDAHTGKAVMETEKGFDIGVARTGMDPAHLNNLQSVGLLADAARIYLACNANPDAAAVQPGTLQSNLTPERGMRALPVNGMIYVYDRRSGEFKYWIQAPHQTVTLDRFEEMPMLLLTSRYFKPFNGGRGGIMQPTVAAMIVDKEFGKTLYVDKPEMQNPNQSMQFHTLQVNAREGYIDLVSQSKRLRTLLHAETVRGKAGESAPAVGPVGARNDLPRRMTPAEAPQVEIKR